MLFAAFHYRQPDYSSASIAPIQIYPSIPPPDNPLLNTGNAPLNTIKFTAPITMLLAGVLLTGCSGAPSQGDIKNAYQDEVDQANALTRKFGGEGMTIKVNEVKKVDCKQSTHNKEQFICQVELDTTLPIVGHQHQATSLTLTKGDTPNGSKGWIILRGSDAATE